MKSAQVGSVDGAADRFKRPRRSEHATRSSYFRAINEEMVRASGAGARGVALIVCECDSEDCSEALTVDIGEYEWVRRHEGRFFVAAGHQDGQRVLTKNRQFAVVELVAPLHAVRDGGDVTAASRPRRVLVVDAAAALRMLCSVNLEAEGFSVIEASDGREGLELARSERPDLILTDIQMPRRDGFDLVEALRCDEMIRETPVIFMSGHHDYAVAVRANKLGAIAVVKKPFDPSLLVSIAAGAFA
jgi:CheY-like chemotaxis protein